MHLRYLARVILTSLAFSLVISTGAAARTQPTQCRAELRNLYSPRALRRLRTILQLRILEARRARLALAKAAIERRATIAQLLAAPDDAAVLSQGPAASEMKHLRIPHATSCW